MAGAVLVCGSIVMDVVARPVDRLVWGATTWLDSLEQHMGGNGASTACTLGTLGAPVRLLSAVGSDEFGGRVLGRLAAAGVDVSAVTRTAGPSAASVALVNSEGERLLLHHPGPNAEIFSEPLDFSGALAAGITHFHLGNLFALPLLRRHAGKTVRRARQAGLTTSLDTGWDSQGRWIEDLGPCLPYTDLLFVNEDEARRLGSAEDALSAAGRLRELGAGTVIVKLGGRGCALCTAAGVTLVPAFDVVALDTTGAGDCFAGAFLAAVHHGLTPEDAALAANAVAALTIQQLGATTGLRSWEQTRAWMATGPRRAS